MNFDESKISKCTSTTSLMWYRNDLGTYKGTNRRYNRQCGPPINASDSTEFHIHRIQVIEHALYSVY